ncbi:hypothetical protein VST7929_03150 [Vibrio stylophorae]|uniref:CAAX prenyl protease 2/Lysostaphin resistance protein A-like domain-containing protein n=1 Tax=Vibrio stylophorae TaxID=659351 RepID=A0ABM8ZXT2_9VIBR|nr:CPBP family glutamic-type intramembrane protease [Vibrio stylophorae]CAH0535630.1 hypothetical protein VST7929_03150 [Vibrio stylophorae]
MLQYFRNHFSYHRSLFSNPWWRQALTTSPLNQARLWLPMALLYALLALAIGYVSQLFQWQPISPRAHWWLILTLFVFPCVLEEGFFRYLLLTPVLERSAGKQVGMALLSSALFVLWHPLNAWLWNPTAQPFFYNFAFLTIVFCLGLCCAYGYFKSRSFWVPVLIHWWTVLVWVFLLSGHNLLKAA